MSSVKLTGNFLATARCLIFADSSTGVWSFNSNTNTLTINAAGGLTGLANPTAKVGLTAVNGSASTAMRSDGAPPIDQGIAPTWTGLHTFSAGVTISAGAFTLNAHTLTLTANASIGGTNTGDQTVPTSANPTATVGLAAVNGSAATWMTSDSAPALSQAIAPTWTGKHIFTPGSAVVAVTINGNTNQHTFDIVAGSSTGIIGQLSGNTATGGYLQIADNVNAVNRGYIGYGAQMFTGGAISDFGIAAQAGILRFSINGGTSTQMQLSTAGALTIVGALGVNGNAAPAQSTGWGTPTGAVVNNYNGAAATLLQTSDALGQLLSVLKSIGILGA